MLPEWRSKKPAASNCLSPALVGSVGFFNFFFPSFIYSSFTGSAPGTVFVPPLHCRKNAKVDYLGLILTIPFSLYTSMPHSFPRRCPPSKRSTVTETTGTLFSHPTCSPLFARCVHCYWMVKLPNHLMNASAPGGSRLLPHGLVYYLG